MTMNEQTSADYGVETVAETKDGYTIVALRPGYRVYKGKGRHKTLKASVALWTEAVAFVLVEREADQAIRKN